MKKFYLSAPIDEFELLKETLQKYPEILKNIPSSEMLKKIQTENGVDMATMALYHAILKSPKHSQFVNKINSQTSSSVHSKLNGFKIGLLPAMFHAQHPEVGGGGEHILKAAQNCGFSAERIEAKSTGGVIENAKILQAWLQQQQDSKIILITMSKGSLEFRYAWSHLLDENQKNKIHSWLNFSGFPNGNALAGTILNSKWQFIKSKIIARLIGLSPLAFIESSPSFEAWKNPLLLDSRINVYSFFPIPLSSHVQTSLIGRYAKLSRVVGPNDGMTDCFNAIHWDGDVYPIWGADHFCRTTEIVPLLYKTFSFLRQEVSK